MGGDAVGSGKADAVAGGGDCGSGGCGVAGAVVGGAGGSDEVKAFMLLGVLWCLLRGGENISGWGLFQDKGGVEWTVVATASARFTAPTTTSLLDGAFGDTAISTVDELSVFSTTSLTVSG